MTKIDETTSSTADRRDSARRPLPPNHHAGAGPTVGIVAYLSGLTMVVGRRRDAEFVTQLAQIDETDHVVDIGCGPGTAARTAARTGAHVTGVDPSPPMLRLARLFSSPPRRRDQTQWCHGAAEQLPLPDGSSSVCWSLASVHHWRDLDAAIREVMRVLRRGGRFIVLERRSPEGASGLASHGWTRDQADRFASLLIDAGFLGVQVLDRDLGRRRVVSVTAIKPARPSTSVVDRDM